MGDHIPGPSSGDLRMDIVVLETSSVGHVSKVFYTQRQKNRYAEDKAPKKRVLTAFSYLIMKNRHNYEKHTNVFKVAVQDVKPKTYST